MSVPLQHVAFMHPLKTTSLNAQRPPAATTTSTWPGHFSGAGARPAFCYAGDRRCTAVSMPPGLAFRYPVLAVLLLSFAVMGWLRRRGLRCAGDRRRPSTSPPVDGDRMVQKSLPRRLSESQSNVMKATDGESCTSQGKGPEAPSLVVQRSVHKYFIFKFVTFDFDLPWKRFAPIFLALRGSSQGRCLMNIVNEGSHVHIVDEKIPAHFKRGRRRACKKLTCSDNLDSSSRPLDADKIKYDSCLQQMQRREELCSSGSCDTSCCSGSLEDVSAVVDRVNTQISKKIFRKKGKRNKSSAPSNNPVLSEASNCHIEACEDDRVAKQKMTIYACNAIPDPTEKDNSYCSDAALDSFLPLNICLAVSIKDNELEGASSLQISDEGLSFDSLPVGGRVTNQILAPDVLQETGPNLEAVASDAHPKKEIDCCNFSSEKLFVSASDDSYILGIENSSSSEEKAAISAFDCEKYTNCEQYFSTDHGLCDKNLALSDNTGDLHVKVTENCDTFRPKVEGTDVTDEKTGKEQCVVDDNGLITSRKKTEESEQTLQAGLDLESDVNMHEATSSTSMHEASGCETNHFLEQLDQSDNMDDYICEKNIQPLSVDCDILVGLDEESCEKFDTLSVVDELHNQADFFGAVDSPVVLSEFEDEILVKDTSHWSEGTSNLILSQEQCCNISRENENDALETADLGSLLPENVQGSNIVAAEYEIVEMVHKGLDSATVDCLNSEEANGKTAELERGPCYVPACHLSSHADRKPTLSNTCSSRIVEAVRDAYMSQIESEEVQLAAGGPIAAFERLLYSASPVISLLNNRHQCETCKDGAIGNTVCRHGIPNMLLKKFWRRYESAGSFGIEVNVDNAQFFRRLGPGQVAYTAYFVPYLSAIQLFEHSNSSSDTAGTKACNRGGARGKSKKSAKSFSGLRVKNNSKVCHPNSSNASISSASCDDLSGVPQLVFEYFEADRPQERKPIHEKIKELAGGERSTNCHMSKDPSKFKNMRMHELHPSSWYSVAWYPIYRIPGGNLRAAFLTYHSLGHFIQRDAPEGSLHGDTCIVCPAVGLQIYNYQKESWLDLQIPSIIHNEGGNPTKPGELLKRRLQTLDATASTMSMAKLHDGKHTIVNCHPDYEFFLSRRA